MTLFWLWVSVGCALSALIGFSTVRLGARKFGTDAWGGPESVRERSASRSRSGRHRSSAGRAPCAPRSGADEAGHRQADDGQADAAQASRAANGAADGGACTGPHGPSAGPREARALGSSGQGRGTQDVGRDRRMPRHLESHLQAWPPELAGPPRLPAPQLPGAQQSALRTGFEGRALVARARHGCALVASAPAAVSGAAPRAPAVARVR